MTLTPSGLSCKPTGREASYQVLAQWIDANGYRSVGFAREVYLDYDPNNTADGVTDLQIPVEKV